jgi:hypothetical protein
MFSSLENRTSLQLGRKKKSFQDHKAPVNIQHIELQGIHIG